MAFSGGRMRPHSRFPSTCPTVMHCRVPGGSLPAGLSHSCVHNQGKSKTPNQMQTEATTENSVSRPGAENKTEFKYQGAGQADHPSQLTVSVLSLAPSSGPFALVPAASRVVPSGRAGEGGAVAGPPGWPPASAAPMRSSPDCPPGKGANIT